MNAFKRKGFFSRVRMLFATPADDTRSVREICDIRSAFAKEAERLALTILTIAFAFTLATVLGLLLYGVKVSTVRLLFVALGFVLAHFGVFAASVAYMSAKCDPSKVSQSKRRFARPVAARR
jgi:quinol-cytochrome oxidoreductase complex cytochrome b subunit